LVGHLAYSLILPIGIRFLNVIGLRRSLRISVILDAFYLTTALFIPRDPFLFASLSALFVVLARLFFWLPYHIDFAKMTDKSNRGKEVGVIWATHSFLGIIMPLAAGLLIGYFNFTIVFILAVALYLASAIPFLFLPRTGEKFEWGYFETLRNFFKKENRPLVLANLANGAENAVALVIWPIFIWEILAGNYVAVGAVSSLIVLAGVILQLFVGKYTDIFNKRRLLHWGSMFYAVGWLFKIFVLTGFEIFIAGAYHQFTQIFKDTPFDALNYEILADHGHFVDEYTVIKEIAVQMGKVIILALAILVVASLGLNWVFALAALACLFINLL
ncbi:MAG: hypothetical protein MUC28_04015, partial [Planctomycetes bacterium]|nr:hypothetical protein [Planctomycetota bacterium]